MKDFTHITNGRSTAESRWARFGPYYAMFPVNFAFDVIHNFSREGDYVIDPFAGRGTSIFASAALGRNGYGIEINPVGWLYGKTKLSPSPLSSVVQRLTEIYSKRHYYYNKSKRLPEFYHLCFW